jgi:hypothetical protein
MPFVLRIQWFLLKRPQSSTIALESGAVKRLLADMVRDLAGLKRPLISQ